MPFPRSLQVLALSAAVLNNASYSQAHMQMSWPYPFRSKFNPLLQADQIDYNLMAPVNEDGSDFPCKGYERDTDRGPSVSYLPGSTYNMTLYGTATHGGGSCQISLSYDQGATFHVIKSMIGGCPLKSTYDFTVPAYAPPGPALLAWTWQNRLGNREYYMNCAPVEVMSTPTKRQTGPNAKSIDDLPSIWVANLPTVNNCTTQPGQSPVYPFPGPEVEYGDRYGPSSLATAGDCEMTPRFSSYGTGSGGDERAAVSATSSLAPAAQQTGPGGNSMARLDALLVAVTRPTVAARIAGSYDPASSGTVTVYTTITACPSESVYTVYATQMSTWTTSYFTATASPTSTPNGNIVPYPPASPRFVSQSYANTDAYLPCVPNSLLCSSQSTFLTCAPAPQGSSLANQWSYIYGYERTVAAGMACLPFESPNSSSSPTSKDEGTPTDVTPGTIRDDRYIRARPDGSCSADSDGAIRCSPDGGVFYVCDHGGWVNMGAVAAGTTCSNGAIVAT